MLKLIERCPDFVSGYKEYCNELYDNNVTYFRPTNPDTIDETWFSRTKDWYDRKQKGLNETDSPSFHFWAVDENEFIGEFQLRTKFTEKVLTDIGSIGYAVKPSRQNQGYGTQILRLGLEIAKSHKMEKVLLTINEKNIPSILICEKLGGKLTDTIKAHNEFEGDHFLRRYWIYL